MFCILLYSFSIVNVFTAKCKAPQKWTVVINIKEITGQHLTGTQAEKGY